MPSSLTGDRSSTLGSSPLPTGVGVRYGRPLGSSSLRGFSWRPAHPAPLPPPPRGLATALGGGLLPSGSGFAWTPASGGRPTLSVRSAGARYRVPPSLPNGPAQDSPPAVHRLRWLLVLHQPRLRSRLTLGRLPLPRNPQASGVGGSRSHWRYSFRHSRFGSLHARSRGRFSATPERSPTTCWGAVRHPVARTRSPTHPRLRWAA